MARHTRLEIFLICVTMVLGTFAVYQAFQLRKADPLHCTVGQERRSFPRFPRSGGYPRFPRL